MNQRLHLHLFGSPQISYQGEPLNNFISAKVRALLIYLAVTARPHSRDHLAHLLWSDTPASMKVNLRKALSNLRQLLGDLLVENGKELVSLDMRHCWVDVREFEQRIGQQQSKAGSFETVAPLYTADFLAGFNISVCYEFETWVLSEQSRLKSQMVDWLRKAASQAEQTGDLSAAIANVRRLLELEPWQEEAHRWLMRLLVQNGQRSAALAHFEVCKKVLKEELAVEPSEETLQLVEGFQRTSETAIKPRPVLTSTPKSEFLATNLPMPSNRLIGREKNVTQVISLLQRSDVRLLTLTGPGGIGKTRLALQVAHEWVTTMQEVGWFVALASVNDASSVIPTIAQTIGVHTPPNESVLASLQNYLYHRQTFLLLDNFEHLINAAPIIGELITSVPGLKILVTSRTVLHMTSEYIFHVPPLDVPEVESITDILALAQCASVQLILERTLANGTQLELTPKTAHNIAHICRRLEGLPLAIELIAPRCKLFTPHELLARLDHRLHLLIDGGRDLPSRQRTLRLTLDWSFQLLTVEEQRIFARLSVFVGSFTLKAVETVCMLPQEQSLNIVEGIQTLLEHSLLLHAQQAQDERRFMMLETIRDYALEQLVLQGEESILSQQHAIFFLDLAETSQLHLFSTQQKVWFQQLILEQSNFLAALRWWRTRGDFLYVARLSAALCWFWRKHGEIRQEARWGEWALAEMDIHTTPIAIRAKALQSVALSSGWLGDFARARKLFEEYLRIEPPPGSLFDLCDVLSDLSTFEMWAGNLKKATRLEDRRLELARTHNFINEIADSLKQFGYLALWQGEVDQANKFLQESLILRKQIGSITGIAAAQGMLGKVVREQGDFQQARHLFQQSLELFRTLDDQQGIGWISSELGIVAQLQHDYELSFQYQCSALELDRKLGFQFMIVLALIRLGNLALVQNDYETARNSYSEGLRTCQRIDQQLSVASALEGLAGVAVRCGQAKQTARWLGAAEAHRHIIGVKRSIDEQAIYDQTITMFRATLGSIFFAEMLSQGRTSPLGEILTEALSLS